MPLMQDSVNSLTYAYNARFMIVDVVAALDVEENVTLQIETLAAALAPYTLYYAYTWIDVSDPEAWTNNAAANVAILTEAVQALVDSYQSPAIFTSASAWKTITADSTHFNHLGL